MKDPCADYLKQVRRHLSCPGWEKKRLLAGLELEIADAFPDGVVSLSAVVTRFGPPVAVARELEAVLPPELLEHYVDRKRLLTRVGFLCCGVLIALLVGYIAWSELHEINYIVSELQVIQRTGG